LEKDSALETLVQVEAGAVTWGAMFWLPLMAGANDAEIIEWWRRLRDEKVPEDRRADVTQIALVLSELVGRRKDWERAKEGVIMTESAVVNEILEEGAMEESRTMLRRVIQKRFPALWTTEIQQAITDQPNLDLLRDWLMSAATLQTADEFLAVLRR